MMRRLKHPIAVFSLLRPPALTLSRLRSRRPGSEGLSAAGACWSSRSRPTRPTLGRVAPYGAVGDEDEAPRTRWAVREDG
jgi:hypothetical protein